MKIIKFIMISFFVLLLVSCGSSSMVDSQIDQVDTVTDVGNPSEKIYAVKGQLDVSVLENNIELLCTVAVDEDDAEIESEINEYGEFSLQLVPEKSYQIFLYIGEDILAEFIFEQEDGSFENILYFEEEGEFDLGKVIFDGKVLKPENEPMKKQKKDKEEKDKEDKGDKDKDKEDKEDKDKKDKDK